MRKVLIAAVFLLAANNVQAETRLYAHFGYAFGGDRLATVEFEDGTEQDLRAGAGYAVGLGFVHHFDDVPFSLQANVGYFMHNTTANNSHARFSRYPLEVLGFWSNGGHRFGGGLVHHMSPTLNLDNLGGRINFDAATGFALEYGYTYFSVRYTSLDYRINGFDISGESVGLHLSAGF